MSEDSEVGYKKPPKHSRFKPGQSGNPKGRPKGSRNFSTDLKQTLKERVHLNKGGRRKTVSTQLATLMRLREKALSGDARALDRYIDLAQTYNDEEVTGAAARLGSTDAEILDAHNARVLQRTGKAQPDDNEVVSEDPAQAAGPEQESDGAPEAEDDDAWLR